MKCTINQIKLLQNSLLRRNYSSNIEEEITSLFEKTYKDEAISKNKKNEIIVKYIPIYIDMSDNFIITKYILRSFYTKLCELLPSFDHNHTYNINVILVLPTVKKIYLAVEEQEKLLALIAQHQSFAEQSTHLTAFPNYSRLKSHVTFITNALTKWMNTINFTKSMNALPKHINKKIEEVTIMFNNNNSSNFKINFTFENKKICNIKKDNINQQTIIIPKESDITSETPLYESFITNIIRAVQYRATLVKNNKSSSKNKTTTLEQ